MQKKMKKRREHHRNHWKHNKTHAPLIYGGKLHGDSTDSRFVCLLFVVHTFVWMRFVYFLVIFFLRLLFTGRSFDFCLQ